MTQTGDTDTIDRLIGLAVDTPLHAVRHARDKVAVATQGSENSLLDPQLEGLTLAERLLVALLGASLTPSQVLVQEYQNRLAAEGVSQELTASVAEQRLDQISDPRLSAILRFTHTLITDPIRADKKFLLKLKEAGLSTPEVVTLAQLSAFMSYQVRLAAGLAAMKSLGLGS